MKSFEVKATLRKEIGKKESKKIRKEHFIPCVLYGGKENVNFTVFDNDIRNLIYSPHTYLIDLNIEGKKHKAIIKDIQAHPVTDSIIHIDFLEIFADKKITMKIPVALNGSSEGVKQGGKLKLEHRLLKVRGLYKDLPDQIDINVDELGLGKSIKVGELQSKKLEYLDLHNLAVVTVKSSRVAVVAPTEEKTE